MQRFQIYFRVFTMAYEFTIKTPKFAQGEVRLNNILKVVSPKEHIASPLQRSVCLTRFTKKIAVYVANQMNPTNNSENGMMCYIKLKW
jgi:hypothetical protein